jgi:hypothetical protein
VEDCQDDTRFKPQLIGEAEALVSFDPYSTDFSEHCSIGDNRQYWMARPVSLSQLRSIYVVKRRGKDNIVVLETSFNNWYQKPCAAVAANLLYERSDGQNNQEK